MSKSALVSTTRLQKVRQSLEDTLELPSGAEGSERAFPAERSKDGEGVKANHAMSGKLPKNYSTGGTQGSYRREAGRVGECGQPKSTQPSNF